MKQLTISVIIVAYNEEKYIEGCLRSLKAQSLKLEDLIVVDDGSTDRTYQVVKKYTSMNFQQDHLGTAKARNFAAKKAMGDILVFLDADMEFEKDFIEKLVEPIQQGAAHGTFSKLEYVKNWDKPLARCWNRVTHAPDKLRIPQTSNFGADFRAILKSEFDRVGGFDDIGYTDTWTLGKKLGYKSVNAPQAIYYHYNPETYGEVFSSARWIGKREYKFGVFGVFYVAFRSFFISSVIKGFVRAVQYQEPIFLPFQLVFDFGIGVGNMTWLFFGEVKK